MRWSCDLYNSNLPSSYKPSFLGRIRVTPFLKITVCTELIFLLFQAAEEQAAATRCLAEAVNKFVERTLDVQPSDH